MDVIVIYCHISSLCLCRNRDVLPIITIERWPRTRDPPDPAPAKAPQRAVGKGLFPTDSDTHLLDRVNAIYKYRYVVLTVFLLVLLAVAVRTFTTTPMYRATTSVLIEDERAASVAGFNSATSAEYISDPEPYYQTQLRILTGRELAAKVVARLNLASVAEFNGQGPQRTGLASVLDTMKRQARWRHRAGHRGRASAASIGARDEGHRHTRQQFPRRGQRRSRARQPALQRLGSIGRSRVRCEGRRRRSSKST